MTVRIRIAASTVECDAVFRLRHQVFVEEGGYMPARPDQRLFDRFDAYPTTANVIAQADGRIVGSVRFTARAAVGSSTDEFFDFRPYLPPGGREFALGMLVLERAFHHRRLLVEPMLSMGYLWCIRNGATHIVSALNPERRDAFLQRGWQPVGAQFASQDKGLPTLPIVLELDQLEKRTRGFLQRHSLQHWLHSFERQFHTAGETVLRQGDPGDAAYVIVDGLATVLDGDGHPGRELTRGDLFGELALLTARPRTATVVAATDLDLMVLERDAFRQQLRSSADAAEHVIEMLAERLAAPINTSNARLALA